MKVRWHSIPKQGRYALRVFGGAIGVVFPLIRPAIMAGLKSEYKAKPKSAPSLNTEFAIALEKTCY